MDLKKILLNNSSPRQTIIKNIFWLFSGQTIGRLLRALLLIYAARLLGAESWGAFSYALSIAAFLSIFADLGINAFITKEASCLENNVKGLIPLASTIKFSALIFFIFLTAIISPFISKTEEVKWLILVSLIIFAFDSIRDFGSSLARARERMEFESFANILSNVFIVIFGFTAMALNPTSFYLASGYALGNSIGALFLIFRLRERFTYFSKNISLKEIKHILRASLPFCLTAVMGAVMINSDIVILWWFSSARETGIYSAAQKPIQLLYLVPSLIAASFFPLMSRLAKTQKEKFKEITAKASSLVILFSLPISLGGIILGSNIINLLYGQEYAVAALSFKLLAATFVLVSPSIILGNAAFAAGLEKSLISYSLAGMLGNIILDFALIPYFGIAGCALATLINQLIITAFLKIKIKKATGLLLFPYLKKIIFSSFIMSIFTLFLFSLNLNILLIIPASAILYFLLLFFLKEKLLNFQFC